MATLHWKPGVTGSYDDPANWVEGRASAPGDTAIVTGPAPQFFDAGTLQPGETISGQTIDFQNADTSHALTGLLSNTTIAGDTTINVTGSGTTLLQAYVNHSQLAGTINVGAAGAPGTFELGLIGNSSLQPLPVTTNTGKIKVASGSTFKITPYTGGYTGALAGNPFDGRYAEFDNEGTISVGPGGAVLDSGLTSNLGQYDSSFVNNGTILVRGAEAQGSIVRLNTNVSGNGMIVVDGGNANAASETGLVLSGNVSGQNIMVRDAAVSVESLRNVPRATSGNLTFEDGNSYLYVTPGDGTVPNGQETAVNPFGMTIHGFRAGDTIAFLHEYAFGTESYTPLWDQGNHQLTVMATNSLHPDVSNAVAQFTLAGNYAASDFQVNFVEPLKTGLHPQIDITTTHQEPANFAYSDVTAQTSGGAAGDVYTGPVDYLQWQYIWSSPDSIAISANQPNAFLHGGSGNDALAAYGGSNVLDGGDGSNFLVGASGRDGGVDTFFVDGRGGGTTWSTVVNIHAGDLVTFWGFDASKSAYSWADNDGAAGYTGATIHAAIGGAGTPVNASLTFAGLSMADAQSKLAITTGNVQGQDYMLLRYAG